MSKKTGIIISISLAILFNGLNCVGYALKIMHWPGNTLLRYFSLGGLVISVAGIIYFIFVYKKAK